MANPYSQDDVNRAEQITFQVRSLTEELKDQLGIRSRLNETEKAQLNLARELQRSAQLNTIEIGNQGTIGRQLIKDNKTLLKIQLEKAAVQAGTTAREKNTAERIVRVSNKILTAQEELATASGNNVQNLQTQLQSYENQLNGILQVASSESQRLAVMMQLEVSTQKLIKQREEEDGIQKKINDKMGVSGALVKGTGALMERLGMRSGIFHDAMSESAEVMREMAEESTRLIRYQDTNGNIVEGTVANYSKLDIMLKGFSKLSEGFGKALFDPFTISTAILNNLVEINKTQTETTRLIGQSAATFDNALNTKAATLNEVMKQINETTKELGMNAQAIFSPDTLASMTEGVNMLGLTGEQATRIGLASDYIGRSVDGYADGILRGVDAGNKLAKSAVAPGVALQDALNASEEIALSLGQNPEQLGKAVTAARALGLELSKVESIADSLMDFEASIGNELEAQLLTGKQINLNKAREFALNNDLAGLATELANNGATAAEFSRMNRIQQESLAKALGMSRQELAKSIILQDKSKSLTDEARAQVLGMTVDDLKRADIQENINRALQKMLQLVAPILETVTAILSKWWAMYPLMIALGGAGLIKLAMSVKGLYGSLQALLGLKKAIAVQTAIENSLNSTNIASTVGQTAANNGLAVSNSTISATSKPAAFGLKAMGTALGAFGAAAAPAIPILFSIAAVIASVGVAAAGLGFGFKMAADGVVNIMNNLTMNKLKPLFLLGPALLSIAAGLGAISIAGLAAIPALAALSGLALMATPLIMLGDMFGEGASQNNELAAVEAKLDTLIAVVQQGGNVYLDNSKVGTAMVLGTYRQA